MATCFAPAALWAADPQLDVLELRKLAQAPAEGETIVPTPTPTPATPGGDSTGLSAEALAGADVLSVDGEDIGTVSGIVFTAAGDISAAVVSVGGFLGFGRHSVAIPVDDLQVEPGDVDTGDDLIVKLPLTEDQVRAMPEYAPTN
ncbi:MAG: PRC-barrel domain-containing protein [Pseudomonadota bacterium]